MKYAIIVVGYNRPEAIERLLKSLCSAEYEGILYENYVIRFSSGMA